MSEYRLSWAQYRDDAAPDDETPEGFPNFGPAQSVAIGRRVLKFGADWRYANNPETVLEIVPDLGRSRFYVWEFADDAPDKLYQSGPRWVRAEDDAGIYEMLMGDDAECIACRDELPADAWPDFCNPAHHDSDCPMAEDGADPGDGRLDAVEGDFCCWDWMHAYSDACYKQLGRSGLAEYVLLDGGDTLCRYHLWAEYDLVVDHSSRSDTLVSVLERYAAGASVEALYWETQAHAARARHNEAEYELGVAASWRDRVITNLRRLDFSQESTANLVGVSQQRISQLERVRESSRRETIRGLVARLRDEGIDPPEDWIELVD